MHLSEYDIAVYLENKTAGKERATLESHLSACAVCAAAVGSAFKALQMAERTQAPPLPGSVQEKAEKIAGRKAASFFSFPARIAASILLFAGLGYWAVSSWPRDESRFRSSGSALTIEASAPRDNEVLGSAPAFRWTAVPEVDHYELSVYTDDGVTILKERLKTNEFTAPASVVFQPGNLYLWKIQAKFPDGSSLSSELHTFRTSPR